MTVIRTFPRTDQEFANDVGSIAERLESAGARVPGPTEVEHEIRHLYRNATVRVQTDLGRLVGAAPIWYVFRDGAFRHTNEGTDRLMHAIASARRTCATSTHLLERSSAVAARAGFGPPGAVDHNAVSE